LAGLGLALLDFAVDDGGDGGHVGLEGGVVEQMAVAYGEVVIALFLEVAVMEWGRGGVEVVEIVEEVFVYHVLL
jgi:hypothetical protein